MKATHLSINQCLAKQNVVDTHHGLLSSLKKEGNSDNLIQTATCNLKDIMLSAARQILKDDSIICGTQDCQTHRGRRNGGYQGRGEERMESCLMGTEFQFGMMKKFWRLIVAIVTSRCKST